MSKKVFISAGHGGTDSGAIGNGFYEKDLNLDIALACNNYLVQHGVTTLMSRTTDEDDSVQQEVKECNTFAPDLAISFHNNAGGGDGCEAFCSVEGGFGLEVGNKMLTYINAMGQNIRSGSSKSICCKTKTLDNGQDYYYFIRNTLCHAVIIEIAFIDNATDIKFIDTLEERKNVGVECAKAILDCFGISYNKPKQLKDNNTIADEVIKGFWGTGLARKQQLEEAGYNYEDVQSLVNKKLGHTTEKPKKSNSEIAAEVIKGMWGNGAERKERLTQAGYNYNTIQSIVNKRLGD